MIVSPRRSGVCFPPGWRRRSYLRLIRLQIWIWFHLHADRAAADIEQRPSRFKSQRQDGERSISFCRDNGAVKLSLFLTFSLVGDGEGPEHPRNLLASRGRCQQKELIFHHLILSQAPPPSFRNLRACETLTARALKRERRASPAVTTLINLDFNDTDRSSRRVDARQEDV